MKKFIALLLIFSALSVSAQNPEYARMVVDNLAGAGMYGRGYVNGGDSLAAEFIAAEFYKSGLVHFGDNYFQKYTFTINTFPGELMIKTDNRVLTPGVDYNIAAYSGNSKGVYEVFRLNETKLKRRRFVEKMIKVDFSNKVILAPMNIKQALISNNYGAAGFMFCYDKLPAWSVYDGSKQLGWFSADVLCSKVKKTRKKTEVNIESVFKKHNTNNVIAYVPGKIEKDSFIVFTAHYDHLGQMGKDVVFPGANDNASGVALMLDLALHFSKIKDSLTYSVAFMAFSGEEAGLLGSFYYADNPLFPLDRIKAVVNLDMVGTGSEGIKVVNGTEFPDLFGKMTEINNRLKLLESVGARGASANSDHYPFVKKGVPALFIYTTGKEHPYYHSLLDKPEGLPFTAYNGLFVFLVEFLKSF